MFLDKLKSHILSPLGIIIILHLVGFFVILSSFQSYILPLSWVNLGISGYLALQSQSGGFSKPFVIWMSVAFLTGMITEAIGVNTGILFGDYFYLENLGPKVFGVPLIIGLNWTYLIVGSAGIAALITKSFWFKVILSAAFMLLIDWVMEPMAIALDFWHWETADIPLKNYLCWFLISLPLSYLYFVMDFKKQNNVAIGLYIVQLLFFGILNFTL